MYKTRTLIRNTLWVQTTCSWKPWGFLNVKTLCQVGIPPLELVIKSPMPPPPKKTMQVFAFSFGYSAELNGMVLLLKVPYTMFLCCREMKLETIQMSSPCLAFIPRRHCSSCWWRKGINNFTGLWTLWTAWPNSQLWCIQLCDGGLMLWGLKSLLYWI